MNRLSKLVLVATLTGCGPVLAQEPLLQPVAPGTAGSTAQPLTAKLDPEMQARIASLESRLARLERVFENQVVRELLQSIDQLQGEVRELRGELESQYNEIDVLEKRQRDLYRDSDQRLRELEVGATAAVAAGVATGLPGSPAASTSTTGTAATQTQSSASTAAGSTAAGSTGAAAAAAAATTTAAAAAATTQPSEADEKAAYVAAFEHLKTGQYDEAITAYGDFLQKFPNGRYADNAQYWLGEANYVSRHFETALNEFQKVLSSYPSSPKVADSRLKIGFAYYEMERWDEARGALEGVMKDYPDSSVARLARQRIVRMKKEGH